MQKVKKPSDSAVETRYLVMPSQTNPYGSVFGGIIMSWIDMVASMAARRHCKKEVVTASIDSMSFRHPAFAGDQVVLKACVNYVGKTSMEVGVLVMTENPDTSECIRTTTAHLTFVALDKDKKPSSVPGLSPETSDEKRRYESAKLRVKNRKELLQKLKNLNKFD